MVLRMILAQTNSYGASPAHFSIDPIQILSQMGSEVIQSGFMAHFLTGVEGDKSCVCPL